jgi:hypothetical protein
VTFWRVYKWDWSCSRTVSNTEQIHACYREADSEAACLTGTRNSKGDGDQCVADCHERESCQQQTPPTEGIDRPKRWEREDEVDDAEAEGCE